MSVTTDTIQHLKLSQLQPDPEQPRKYFDEQGLQELADDIKARGIIEPIISGAALEEITTDNEEEKAA